MNLENFLSNSIDLLNKYDLEPEELFYSYLIYCNNLEDNFSINCFIKTRNTLNNTNPINDIKIEYII